MYEYIIAYGVSWNSSTVPSSLSVSAAGFAQEDGFLVFKDDAGIKVLAVPVALNPVVTKAATT